MDDIPFYKSLYDRELSRRVDLDNSINIPIGAITLLFTLIYYIINNIILIPCCWINVLYVFTSLSVLLIFISVFFLVRSYNNLFKGFDYLNFPLAIELRKYQIDLIEHDKDEPNSFLKYLIDKYVLYADNHMKINDMRSYRLYLAKTFIIASMLILLITVTFFIILKP